MSSREQWNREDILGAIGLSIAASGVVLFAGLLADSLYPDASITFATALFSLIASVILSGAVVRFTRLPLAPTVNTLGLATIANVAVHVTSGGGDSDVIGLPPAFIESAILSGVPFAAAWLYVSRKNGLPISSLGFRAPSSGTAYLYAGMAWFVALIVIGLWGLLISEIDVITPPDNATPVLEVAGGSLVVAWLLVGLWGPFVEEVFFRGFLLGALRTRTGYWPALLISSGTFALFHVHPGLYGPTFVLGVAFGWVYLKTRSIWPAIFAHTLHNTLVLITVWQDWG